MEGEDHVRSGKALSSDEPALLNSQDSTSSYETSSEADSGPEGKSTNILRSERRVSERNRSDVLGWSSEDPQGPPHPQTTEKITSRYQSADTNSIDEVADASEASRRETETSPKSSFCRTGVKKRKAEKVSARDENTKRLKGVYVDDYRQLLNRDIQDAVSQFVQEDSDRLPQSQLGCTRWTPTEKNAFFTALARLGRDDVHGIASRVESKSVLEVQGYIQLLRQGLLEKSINEARQESIRITDIPAAVEIGKGCCDMLEKAADALAFRQERHEEREEQSKWGEFWLLTSDVNALIEERLAKDGGGQNFQAILPAAEFLNLRNWLELSTQVFMNPAAPREDENWRFLAAAGEEPSIRATAFTDFHRLAISVTKRLVSAALFCAMSRLRSTDFKVFNRYEIVKAADVRAAARMCGLETNLDEFWMNCPRRCNLKVFNIISSTFPNQQAIEYDEIESLLRINERSISQSPLRTEEVIGHHQPSPMGLSTARIALPHLASVVCDSNLNSSVEPSNGESDDSGHEDEQLPKKDKLKETIEQAHQEYAEAFDMRASLKEEKKLWEIMKQNPPSAIKPNSIELPQKPMQERKEFDEIENWREYMEYWSEWEIHTTPVPPSAFLKPSRHQTSRHASIGEVEAGDKSSDKGLVEESSIDRGVAEGSKPTSAVDKSFIQDEDTTSDEDSDDDISGNTEDERGLS